MSACYPYIAHLHKAIFKKVRVFLYNKVGTVFTEKQFNLQTSTANAKLLQCWKRNQEKHGSVFNFLLA